MMCPLCDGCQSHVKTAKLREIKGGIGILGDFYFLKVKLGFSGSPTPIQLTSNSLNYLNSSGPFFT